MKNWSAIYKKYLGLRFVIDSIDEMIVLAADVDASKAYSQSLQIGKHSVPDVVIDFA